MPLTPFKSLIRGKCGLSFEDHREAILEEGIRTRSSARAAVSHEAYFSLLSCEPEEFKRLVNLITVKETYFFREPEHFKLLTEALIPEISSKTKNRRIRIVCAGCSTGEEPYSIAMALAAAFGQEFFSSRFSIVGFDIDEEALSRARSGLYAQHSFRGLPDHIRKSFFQEQEDGCRIRDTVREGVVFLRLNLFGDSYPDTVRNADIIFYRNVSIYFEPDVQQHIFRNLAELLNEEGYLFLSSAETFVHDIGVLSLIERDGVFLYGKGSDMHIVERRKPRCDRNRSAAALMQGPGSASAAKTKYASIRKNDEPHLLFNQALALAEDKKYEDALQLTERIIGLQSSYINAYMLQAGILLNLQRLDEAEKVCCRSLELDQWSLEGHLLLGLIAKSRGNFSQAKKRFKEALYIKSSCWLAHFYLGEIYRAEGDRQLACREFEIVIKLLEENGFSDHGLTFFSLPFPVEQVVHLCRHTLSDMKQVRV